MKVCCPKMYKNKAEFKKEKDRDHDVIFDSVWREYMIHSYKDRSYGDFCSIINYCPWCGAELPKVLSDEWFDILEEEYGIEDPTNEEKDKVPEEFKTDEWWKKRGL